MYSQFHLDYRDEDHRPAGRHRRPDPEPERVTPPAWATEHSRPIPHLPGEGVTQKILHPAWRGPTALPLPTRAENAALEADAQPARLRNAKLGRALHALRKRVRL